VNAFFSVTPGTANVLHQEVVLDDGAGDADRVALLEGVQPIAGVGTCP
jgi:hypothetical protein